MQAHVLVLALGLAGLGQAQVVHHQASTHPLPLLADENALETIYLPQVRGTVLDTSTLTLAPFVWSAGPQTVCNSGVVPPVKGVGFFKSAAWLEWPGTGLPVLWGSGQRWFDSQDFESPRDCLVFQGSGQNEWAGSAATSGAWPELEGGATAQLDVRLISVYSSGACDDCAGPPLIFGDPNDPDWVWDDFDVWDLSADLEVGIDFYPWPLSPLDAIPYCSSEPNSTGETALLYAGGSSKTEDEALYLSVENVPVDLFGYFIVSSSQGHVPNFGGGEGILCLGAPIYRVLDSLSTPNAVGHVAYWWNPANVPVQVQPGDVWNFQYWFRDNIEPGFKHNTSNGLSITFY
jgi:hypothetical protein